MTGKHPTVGMDLHLRVKTVEEKQAQTAEQIRQAHERHKVLARRQDVIEQTYVTLENSVERQFRSVGERIDKMHEANLDMHEAGLGVAKRLSETLADVVDYRPEIIRSAGMERWKTETWARLKSISIKVGIMAAIVGPLYLLWSNWPRP